MFMLWLGYAYVMIVFVYEWLSSIIWLGYMLMLYDSFMLYD
jgi:hypothetical protein